MITEIHKSLKNLKYEILVQKEEGLGFAVDQGVKSAKGNVIVVMDADGSHDPQELPPMLQLLTSYDIVIGSKRVDGGKSEDSFFRRQISTTYNKLASFLLKTDVKDPMSGFIVARKKIFNNYNFPSGYKFMLPLYTSNKFLITEHPITFHKRKKGKSKTSFFEGLKTLYIILKLCFYMSALGLVMMFQRKKNDKS